MKRYSFHPVMLLRSPAYPFSHISAISLQEHLDKEYFRNALFIAAPEFYQELQKTGFLVHKLKPKAVKALHNYLNRLYYRNTPFGMFSGFSPVRWQGEEESWETIIFKKRRLHVLPELEEKAMQLSIPDKYDDDFLLFSNPSIYKTGNEIRYLKFEYDDHDHKYRFHVSAMPEHKLIAFILAYCLRPTPLGLLKKATKERTEIGEDQLFPIVQHLIGENLLLRKTQNSFLHNKGTQGAIFPESRLNDPRLKEQTRNAYANLQYTLAGGNVPKQQQEKIKNGLEALRVICQYIIPDGLRKFATAFEHKFEGRAIPLMVALDPELGVGYRELEQTYYQSGLLEDIDFPKKQSTFKHVQWSRIHVVFMNKIQAASLLREREIVLDDEDLPRDNHPEKPLPPGISVLFRALNEDIFIESAGGATATALFGRFSIFDQELADTLSSIADNEVQHNPSVAFAEINCLQELHAANVEHRIKVYPYEIPLMTYPASSDEAIIPLSDLWVSVKQGRIIMWSERLKKEVIPRLSSAFNHSRSQMNVYRFLCDLQYQGLQTNFTLDLSHYFPNLDFYPRVTYKGAILSLAVWEIKLPQMTIEAAQDAAAGITSLRLDLAQRGVPRYFASYNGDQQLIYDMESDQDILTFRTALESWGALSIKEFPFPFDNNAVEDAEGKKYLAQYLTALLHQQDVYGMDISEQLSSALLYDIPRETNDWVYFKVYCHPGNSIRILKEVMTLVYQELMAKGLADRYFYVIYLDPGYHLRLRFRCPKSEHKAAVILSLEKVLQPLRIQGWVAGISMDYYQREFERYGPNNMELMERIFDADTSWVMSTVVLGEEGTDTTMDIIASVAALLEAFGLSLEEKIAHCHKLSESLFTEFHGNKELHLSLNNKYRAYKTAWSGRYLSELLNINANPYYLQLSRLIKELVRTIKNDVELQIPLQRFCADIVHMHLNRLFLQQPREQEMVVYYLLHQQYRSQYYRTRH